MYIQLFCPFYKRLKKYIYIYFQIEKLDYRMLILWSFDAKIEIAIKIQITAQPYYYFYYYYYTCYINAAVLC